MSDSFFEPKLEEDEKKLLDGYREGKVLRSELEELEKSHIDLDKAEVIKHMEENNFSSATDAYNHLNGIVPDSSDQHVADPSFVNSLNNKPSYSQNRDELKRKMDSFFDEKFGGSE